MAQILKREEKITSLSTVFQISEIRSRRRKENKNTRISSR